MNMNMNLNLKQQKYGISILLFSINFILSSLFIKFSAHWYAFLGILAVDSVINTSSSLLIFFKRVLLK